MGVKLAKAMGAKVTVFSTSESKRSDAKRLGAHEFVVTRDPKNLESLAGKFDFILDTISAPHSLSPYLDCLKKEGQLVLVGAAPEPNSVEASSLIFGRKNLTGSLIGGIKETQEMLQFCAKHKITADVELISASQVNEAYERTLKSQVKYRFVIDLKTL
jgi:uncharacterized zinc-type alcohol dehydrogenase-like protein